MDQADIPTGQVAGRHGQSRGCEQPTRALLGRWSRGAQALTRITSRIALGQRTGVILRDTFHLQWSEYPLMKEAHQRLTADFLDNGSGDDISGIRVLPLRPRLKVEWAPRPLIDDARRRGSAQHFRGYEVLWPEIPQAGGVVE